MMCVIFIIFISIVYFIKLFNFYGIKFFFDNIKDLCDE